jgi:hypothetical protein
MRKSAEYKNHRRGYPYPDDFVCQRPKAPGTQECPEPDGRNLDDLRPTSIGTSDPANNAAQGTITLDGPAAGGGVTIELFCDRTDVLKIDPSSLVIAEGEVMGTFTATGIAQPIMPTAMLDAIVSASLGTQTLTATLSIRPEAPATTTPKRPAMISMPATAGVSTAAGSTVRSVGIYQVNLSASPPVARGTTIQAQIVLDTIIDAFEHVNIDFEPRLIRRARCMIPPGTGAASGYFSFTVSTDFIGNSLRITATVESSGLSKSIDVAVAP